MRMAVRMIRKAGGKEEPRWADEKRRELLLPQGLRSTKHFDERAREEKE